MNRIALFETPLPVTPVTRLNRTYAGNTIYIKRDDLLPFSFGGNKVRKAARFYEEIRKEQPDTIVTYGSASSNHCRVIASMAAGMGLRCHVITAESTAHGSTLNGRIVKALGVTSESVPVEAVADTIESRLNALRNDGHRPYFIQGGGHGNPGCEAYVDAYREIRTQEKEMRISFDHILHASGTGTTQAGLICGELLSEEQTHRIVGISIAREKERGASVIRDSIREYLGERFEELFTEDALTFVDDAVCGGYGMYDAAVEETIAQVMEYEGIPLDPTYTGKAFCGMLRYLEQKGIEGRNILFLHTGGTPIYFDHITGREEA